MSLMTYPKYKSSGFEWLGRVPEHWNLNKFRHKFNESSEVNGPSPVGEMLSISGYRGVETKIYEDENQKRGEEQTETYRVVRVGQLAVNTMWLNHAGLGVSMLEGHVSPAYRTYWIHPSMDNRYVHHLMRSTAYVDGYTANLTGIRPNSLQMSRSNLMSFPILVPPIQEQRAIADYIDREMADVDAFIADQEQLIALLAERRTATITHAVTKGLDPHVSMKDTGNNWIGNVPEHWTVGPFKRQLIRIEQGVSPEASSELADESSVGVLKAGCVNGGIFKDTQHKRLPDDYFFDAGKVVAQGDLLVNRASGSPQLVGSSAIVRTIRYKLILSDKTFRLRLAPSASPTFIEKFLNSTPYRIQVLGAISGAEGLANNLPSSALRRFTLPVPPLAEQEVIVEYLQRETAEIDAAIVDAQEAIALSKERRAALISAAVTGKIDVRGQGSQANTGEAVSVGVA